MSDYEPKCKKTLPIIFDDRMPASNLTPKLVGRVNDNTEDLKNLYEETDTMQGDIDSLQEDVDGKLDVPETAGTSGQVLTSDGEGGAIWASVGSGEIVVDPTLTVEGAAADAKKTGDEITAIKTDLTQAEALTAPTFSTATNYTAGQYVTYEGAMYQFTQNHAAGAWNSAHVTAVDVAEVLEDFETRKANIDGSYEQMTVGNAEQLVSSIKEEDKVPYVFRTSGGSIDIGDREEDKIIGGTVAWNQLLTHYDFSERSYDGLTFSRINDEYIWSGTPTTNNYVDLSAFPSMPEKFVIGHKYLLDVTNDNLFVVVNNPYLDTYYSGHIYVPTSTPSYFYVRVKVTINVATSGRGYVRVFDLTQMFGSTIADYIYSLEQAHAGDGVAWFRKLFPKDYYPYNAGELLSVSGLQNHVMTGFNQWDEEWEQGYISSGIPQSGTTTIRSKNFCKCLPDTTYYATCGKTDGGNNNKYYLGIVWYDADKNYIGSIFCNNRTTVSPSNARYFKITTSTGTVIYGATYNHDICINISWDGSRNGEYEPYQKWTYPLDSSLTLRGISKLDANNQLYYDGDEYASDGTVTRRHGIVDLGTLTWRYNSNWNGYPAFYTIDLRTIIKAGFDATVGNIICNKYIVVSRNTLYDNDIKAMALTGDDISIRDSAYSDAETFKTAMSGVYLVYEKATVTTEEADPFQNPQIVDDFGTEEYVIDNAVTVPIPVGHDTLYQANLVAKLEMTPNSPEGDGDYIVRQTNGENAYVPITFPADELPAAPTTDGNYVLKCTVASGTATFTWEAQS